MCVNCTDVCRSNLDSYAEKTGSFDFTVIEAPCVSQEVALYDFDHPLEFPGVFQIKSTEVSEFDAYQICLQSQLIPPWHRSWPISAQVKLS